MVYTANELDEKVPVIKDNVVVTYVGDDSVINPSFEDEIEPYVITLNNTGTFILKEIDGERTMGEIVSKVVEYYDIAEDIIKKDLYELINDLEEGNIIVWKN